MFEDRRENNPCSLCAKMRKGALNDAIKDLGCNKIAYAHHEDDVVETMMLSLFYEGRLHTFSPVTHLDKTGLTVIRPLIYMREAEVIGFVNKYQVPVVKSPCPADGHTKREYIKELLQQIHRENPVSGIVFSPRSNEEIWKVGQITLAVINEENYHDEQNKNNILKLRKVLDTLPASAEIFSVELSLILPPEQDWLMPMIFDFSLNFSMRKTVIAIKWRLLNFPFQFWIWYSGRISKNIWTI